MNIELKHFNENKLLKILLFIFTIALIFIGIWFNKYYISIGIAILYINIIFNNINLLYSTLVVLLFFAGTYLSDNIGFRWGRLYYFVILLILVMVIFKNMNRVRLRKSLKDKYIILMILIFAWGILSSLFSIQTILSIKMTISVFLVFLTFYLIPRYFYTDREKSNFMTFLVLPLNLLMTLLSLINLMYFLNIIKLNQYILFWTTKTTIYENPNTFGVRIMLILMLMNVYLIMDKRFRDKLSENKALKLYVFCSYILLIVNLILSAGRASVLGTTVAFIPLFFKYRKKILLGAIPVVYFLWVKKNSLFLLSKIYKGTSGRSRFWEYVIMEVIPKHPIIGVGRGGFQDYVGNIFGVNHMHNSYLNVIMSDGFVGFGLWVIVLVLIFKSILNLEKDKYIFIFSILGFMVYSFFELGIFGEIGLKTSVFWTFVMLIEDKISVNKSF